MYHGTIKWVYIDIFCPVENGYCSLSESCSCWVDAIILSSQSMWHKSYWDLLYRREAEWSKQKAHFREESWKFRACGLTGGWTQTLKPWQPLLWEYSSFRCIFYGSWTEMRRESNCLLVMYWHGPQTRVQLRTIDSKFIVASRAIAALAASETNFCLKVKTITFDVFAENRIFKWKF